MLRRKTIIHRANSRYGSYRVIDMAYGNRPARLLFGDDDSPQSGVALDDNSEMLFNYNQRFIEIAASLQPRKVLMIGGAALTLPMALIDRFSDVTVDVVEIDPLLPSLARQFFNFTDDPRIKVIIQDGRDYIAQSDSSYDLIVVDAFSGMEIPRKLLSWEAAGLYKDRLGPEGVLALNFISAYHVVRPELAHNLLATFETVFASVEIFPAEYSGRVTTSDNLVLVASDRVVPNLDYLQSVSLSPLVGLSGEVIRDL